MQDFQGKVTDTAVEFYGSPTVAEVRAILNSLEANQDQHLVITGKLSPEGLARLGRIKVPPLTRLYGYPDW